MKCPVCNKEYEGNECPRCKFPNVHIAGNYEEGLQELKPLIEEHRKKFLGNIGIELLVRNYGDAPSTKPSPQIVEFGQLNDLKNNGIVWLSQYFSCVKDRGNINLKVLIGLGRETANKFVTLPAVNLDGYYKLGIQVNEDYKFRLVTQNVEDSNSLLCSEWIESMEA